VDDVGGIDDDVAAYVFLLLVLMLFPVVVVRC